MKGKIMRGAALLLAALLVLGYWLLPGTEEIVGSGNNGREKLELSAGESRSWVWMPAEGSMTSLTLRLSGLKKAQGIVMKADVKDPSGREAASVTRAVADWGDGDELTLEGRFEGGTAYTLTVAAEGEGSIKLRGGEENGSFEPALSWTGTKRTRNPVLLYFAAGCLLTAMMPLPEGKRRTGMRTRGIAALLPLGTFLIIAATGLLLVFLKPAYTDGSVWNLWDEETHRMMVMRLVSPGTGGLSGSLMQVNTWTPGYLPLAMGAGLAGLFTENGDTLYRAATAVSVLAYALAAMAAVKHAPRFKAAFMVAAVLPANLYLTTGFTYDTVVIGCILLGAALLLELLEQEGPVTAAQGMKVSALLAFGTAAKPAYSVVLLLLLLIPEKKLGTRGRAWLFRLTVILLLAWCLSSLLLPGVYDTVRSGDSRFEGTDAAAQLQYLNSHPGEWLRVPLGYLLKNWQFLMVEGIAHWAYHGRIADVGWAFFWMLLAAAPLAVCGERERKAGLLKPGRRVMLGGTAVLAEIILILTQYVVSSEVGGGVRGMQARYILPVWILLALALTLPEKLRRLFRGTGPWIAAALWAGCLGTNLWYAVYWLQQDGIL